MSINAIVISEDPENQLRKFSDRFRSYKRADWLYDGIIHGGEVTPEALKEKLLAVDDLVPKVIIDNTMWMSSDRFSIESWKQNLVKYIDIANLENVSFYVLEMN